jgi:capsular exopolysaccharide synthesis family protein
MAVRTSEKNLKNDKILGRESRNKVPFSVVEAYKSLRIHLVSLLDKSNSKVVVISSANASEGKSTTAINLAVTLSQLNKSVVLIDADSRRATVHQKIKIENGKGCLDVINGDVPLKEAVVQYNQYMDIITAGSVFNNPTELFCSNAFERMVTELRNMYDYVVIDTPPINLVSDALVIAQKADGMVMVVRSGVTTYETFKNALMSVNRLGINVLGSVLNGVGAETGKYLKYGLYGSYKKYYRYGRYGYGYGYRTSYRSNRTKKGTDSKDSKAKK